MVWRHSHIVTWYAGIGILVSSQITWSSRIARHGRWSALPGALVSSITMQYCSTVDIMSLVPTFNHAHHCKSILSSPVVGLFSFQNRGLYADPAIVFTNVLLLILVLALSFNRILGLDRFMVQAITWVSKLSCNSTGSSPAELLCKSTTILTHGTYHSTGSGKKIGQRHVVKRSWTQERWVANLGWVNSSWCTIPVIIPVIKCINNIKLTAIWSVYN